MNRHFNSQQVSHVPDLLMKWAIQYSEQQGLESTQDETTAQAARIREASQHLHLNSLVPVRCCTPLAYRANGLSQLTRETRAVHQVPRQLRPCSPWASLGPPCGVWSPRSFLARLRHS